MAGHGAYKNLTVSVKTGEQLRQVRGRVGQQEFSLKIKNLYEKRCCFPKCQISDPRFLVGSHIARWTDNKEKRGELSNGICLCVFHDKAFELGIFSLDKNFKIIINPKGLDKNSSILETLSPVAGNKIYLAKISSSLDSLREHWNRVGIVSKN